MISSHRTGSCNSESGHLQVKWGSSCHERICLCPGCVGLRFLNNYLVFKSYLIAFWVKVQSHSAVKIGDRILSTVKVSVLLIPMGQLKVVLFVGDQSFSSKSCREHRTLLQVSCKSAVCLKGTHNLVLVKSQMTNCHVNQCIDLFQQLEFHFRFWLSDWWASVLV